MDYHPLGCLWIIIFFHYNEFDHEYLMENEVLSMKCIDSPEAKQIMKILFERYPGLKPYLHAKNPFESLIATILSAQTTDARVNKVTPVLFSYYPGPEELARADQKKVIEIIHSIGFYRNKSKNIIETSKALVERFDGKVPSDMKDLLTLPGVGRKTANVVRANAFGYPTMPVDTHVFRVSNRIGLSKSKNPDECEEDLCRILPAEIWNRSHLTLIMHGRTLCKARKALCEDCTIQDHCHYFSDKKKEEQ